MQHWPVHMQLYPGQLVDAAESRICHGILQVLMADQYAPCQAGAGVIALTGQHEKLALALMAPVWPYIPTAKIHMYYTRQIYDCAMRGTYSGLVKTHSDCRPVSCVR